MSAARCSPFWTESPNILWEEYYDFFPFHTEAQKCTSTALNSLTRFGLYFGILVSILYLNGVYLGVSLGIAVVCIAAYYGMKGKGTLREGFSTENVVVTPTLIRIPDTTDSLPNMVGGIEVADKPVDDVIGRMDRTLPTGPNPFMNVLVNEVKDFPNKPPATSVDTPEMSRTFSDSFQTRMYGDPNDVFQHTQNQRTWVVQPATSIPNDRDSFQNWLYRVPGKTCKEGNNTACQTATEGSPVTWLTSQ